MLSAKVSPLLTRSRISFTFSAASSSLSAPADISSAFPMGKPPPSISPSIPAMREADSLPVMRRTVGSALVRKLSTFSRAPLLSSSRITATAITASAVSPSTTQPAAAPRFIRRTAGPSRSTPRESSTRRNTGSTRHSSTAMMITIMPPRISG